MFFWECGMETRISVKDSLCGEECFLRMRESCLLYVELFMLSFSNVPVKGRHSKTTAQA
jgi:hypothetical protein